MTNNGEYGLAIPKSRLLEIVSFYHLRFCQLMPYFFELPRESVKPINISFNEKSDCPEGLFDNKGETPIIYCNPNKSPNFQEARFTLAHESGHYLHYLKRPEYYDLSNHPELVNKVGFDKFKSLNLISQFRELVADMASFEFLRREGWLKSFIDEKKRDVLENWERINRQGDYRRGSFATLVRYHIYKDFYDCSRCSDITTATHLALELFRDVELKHDESRQYLGFVSERIARLEILQRPSEPTLFD